MPSIFTRIVNGEIPCHKVAETNEFLAFLDVSPCAIGHTLVIPKKEIDYIFDLDDTLYVGLMAFAKQVATSIEKAIPCKRIGIAVIGLEIPHAHVHLIPLNEMDEMRFQNKVSLTDDAFKALAKSIQDHI